ncbi:MAG: leucyl aminopeptidase family protein [Leifsonia flava]
MSSPRLVPVFPRDPLLARHADALVAQGFAPDIGSTATVADDTGAAILVGLGEREDCDPTSVRVALALAARATPADEIIVDTAGIHPGHVQAAAEGIVLGRYAFRGGSRHAGWQPSTPSAAWDDGIAVGEAVCLVRDLVNTPPNVMTPEILAERIRVLANGDTLTVSIRDEEWLRQEGFGAVLAIGGGSPNRPRLVELDYRGHNGGVDVCLVGKGVTFDSGGNSLKDADGMMTMKCDMAGAAAVAATLSLLPRFSPAINVRAVLPLVENMPGSASTRPGDVVTARNALTIEILNTDFEGRVILADALAYAAEAEPDAIVDIATLTYASVNALGERTGAVLGDEREIARIRAAAERSGEPFWPFPMPAYFAEQLDSDVADVKNFPGVKEGRVISAAHFLRRFVPESVAWAHLDVAGPAWADKPYELTARGGTGFGVRTLLEYLLDRAH